MTAACTHNLPLTISVFETAMPRQREALGQSHHTNWAAFCASIAGRREGEKDGRCFVPSAFVLEPSGRHVRRIEKNLVSRQAIALDIEVNKKTGKIPPSPREAASRVTAVGASCAIYTSHNHHPVSDIRYRLVCPLSGAVEPDLPTPEVLAARLGLIDVLDTSKVGAQSLFYFPSSPPDRLQQHETIVVAGNPINADWIEAGAQVIVDERETIAYAAQTEALRRREAKIAAGFNSDDSLIEKLRSRFDLESVLLAHGYTHNGDKYRHPNSSSGCYGADIKNFGGIDRVFSHNATDPLHADNLPGWCDVTAIDAFDVVTVLDFGGDRKKAMRELASRFGLAKTQERKELAKLIFRLMRQQAPQEAIESAAFAEGERLGLTRDEVCDVARWVVSQREAA